MNRTIHALRHAKSDWGHPELADHDRSLNDRGRRESKALGAHFERVPPKVALVLCSTATRARQTLEALTAALGDATIEFDERLYGATSEEMIGLLSLVDETVRSVMLIGHNPGMQDLVIALSASGDELERVRTKFPTAALATMSFDGEWAELGAGDCTLDRLTIAKELPAG